MEPRRDLLSGAPANADVNERADAARNRQKVLEAAEALFAEGDPRSVTMDDIARRAGVGRATLYRRYPSTAAIATALLDHHERQVQEQILRGAPPLGPGAPPRERLVAFYEEMVELLEQHLPLTLGAETGARRYATGAYGFWRLHIATLLDAAGLAGGDVLPDMLLAPLAPDLYDHVRNVRGLSAADVTTALTALARRVMPEQ
ncbi:TetR/AcrR family transcriptional regulator [Kribbella swartbergensis]